MATPSDGFDGLLARLVASNVATTQDLHGCTAGEIAWLEARYHLRLPGSYRRYLELMGHRSGRLFTCDHMAVFYRDVLEMTDDVCTRRIKAGEVRESGDGWAPLAFSLPSDALLVAGRLDAQWQFIRCADQADSPVWHFGEDDWSIRQVHVSVLDWLNCWCGIAEEAIAGGYFERYPNGTTP